MSGNLGGINLSLLDVFSLIGVAQCSYVLVYMVFRSGYLVRGGLPALYFLILALAFLMDFLHGHSIFPKQYEEYFHWFFWFMGPPVSVLVVLQVAQITRVPKAGYFFLLLLIPVVWFVSYFMTPDIPGCAKGIYACSEESSWMVVLSCVAGAVSLLSLWFDRAALENVHAYKMGEERFWLIISMVILNVALLFTMLMSLNEAVDEYDIFLVRSVLGLGLAYVIGTGLFRIYPQAVRMDDPKIRNETKALSDEELEIAMKVERLMALDKVYQEAGYSRSDLARECGVSELIISRVINQHFQKSYPTLLNDHRVRDACQLLKETKAPAKVIAKEVGFNSLATFNRVFKDVMEISPSEYRGNRDRH